MPIQSGDFSASQLAQSLVVADRMFSDEMRKADFEADVETFKAIKREQNADVRLLEDSEKDRDVKVYWMNSCNDEATDCADSSDDCDLSGPELGTDSKEYNLEVCKEYKFTVDEMKFRTNNFSAEQAIAMGQLKADKAISNAVARTGVARLESFKGVNKMTGGVGTNNETTGDVDINAADWNERLFAYLYQLGIQNKMSNPFLLSGSNLFQDRIITMLNESNGEGKGAAKLYRLIRTYFDLFNIDAMNAPALKTYLINRGAVAFASKNYYGAVPTVYNGAGQTRYSVASRFLDGVRMDVFYTNRCVGKTIKHDFKYVLKYDYLLNPTGCDGDRTGVLAFANV